MNDTYTGAISLSIFGESHGPAVGATLSGLAAGVPVDEAYIAREMDKRRAAGKLSTKRTEPDKVHFLSGVYRGFTTGTAVTLVIENTNTRSEDYAKTQDLLRPGHADWTAHLKYRGFQDARGGGHFSGRLTAPLVAACAILKQMLEKRGVVIGTHLAQCAGVEDEPLAPGGEALARQLRALGAVAFPALSSVKAKAMQGAIEAAVEQVFDLRPAAIIEALGLKKPIYRALAAYGHMGREDLGVAWENTDKAAALKAALARA